MAISAVYGADSAAAGSSTTMTRTATYTAGDTILVWVRSANATATISVGDGTHTFTQVGSYVTDTTHANRVALFEAKNVAGGSFTITVTWSASSSNRCCAYVRVPGSDNAGAQAGTGQNQENPGTGTDAVTTGSMTPSGQPNAVIALDITRFNAATVSAGTGFTSLGVITSFNSLAGDTSRVEWKRTTSTAATAGTFTYSVNDSADSIGAVYGEAGAGGSAPVARQVLVSQAVNCAATF